MNSISTKNILSACLFVLFFSFSLSAQQDNIVITEEQSSVIFEDQMISIEGTLTECDNKTQGIDNSYVILKITNKTQQTRSFKIQQDLFYDGVCSTCNSDEYLFTFTLAPGQVLKGNCYENNQKLKLYHHMPEHLSPVKLTNYQLNVTHL